MRTTSRNRTFAALAAILAAACGDDAPSTPDTGATRPVAEFRKLVVADNSQPTVVMVDLGTGRPSGESFTLAGPASYLYSSTDGRFVIAHQRLQNRTDIIDGGIALQSGSAQRGPARVVHTVRDSLPTHGTVNGNIFSIFHDGSGNASFWNVRELAAGRTAPLRTINVGATHSTAFAKGNEQFLLVGPREPGQSTPIGVNAYNATTGALVDSARNCPGLHGNGGTRNVVVFGCADGVLVVGMGTNGRPTFSKVAFDAGANWGVGTVWGRWDSPFVLVRAGIRGQPVSTATRRLGIYDAVSNQMRGFTLPDNDIDWTADLTWDGRTAVVLGRTGSLYFVDANTRTLTGRLNNVVAPMPTSGTFPTPSLAFAEGVLYLSSPTTGEVLEISLASASPSIARRLSVGGTPTRIAIVGAMPAAPVRLAN